MIGSGDFTQVQELLARLSPVTELGHLRPPACDTISRDVQRTRMASVELVVATVTPPPPPGAPARWLMIHGLNDCSPISINFNSALILMLSLIETKYYPKSNFNFKGSNSNSWKIKLWKWQCSDSVLWNCVQLYSVKQCAIALAHWIGLDFNAPYIDWSIPGVIKGSPYSTAHEELLGVTQDHGLEQVVLKPTRGNNTLDLFFYQPPFQSQ